MKRKVDTLRENRDYSNLFSDDADAPPPTEERAESKPVMATKSGMINTVALNIAIICVGKMLNSFDIVYGRCRSSSDETNTICCDKQEGAHKPSCQTIKRPWIHPEPRAKQGGLSGEEGSTPKREETDCCCQERVQTAQRHHQSSSRVAAILKWPKPAALDAEQEPADVACCPAAAAAAAETAGSEATEPHSVFAASSKDEFVGAGPATCAQGFCSASGQNKIRAEAAGSFLKTKGDIL